MEENYVSLFEYLGKPAGGEVGKQVYAFAKDNNSKVVAKEIKTKGFTGKVMTYERSLLDTYFNTINKNAK